MDWNPLQNPVFEKDDWSVKDAAVIRRDGMYYLFASAFYHDRERERSHVVVWKTEDWKTFSSPILHIDGREEGWLGLCSPDIVQGPDGSFVMAYNSWGDKEGAPNQLFYRTSADLHDWSEPVPLASNLTAGIRCIDAALAIGETGVLLAYKEKQTPRFAIAETLGAGNWRPIRSTDVGWFENAQLLKIDGRWHLLVTGKKGREHLPFLYACDWDGTSGVDFLKLEPVPLGLPGIESFNTLSRANAAFLWDNRSVDGYFYLLYAGNTENVSHAGRGNNKLGLSRSPDLLEWSKE